MRSVGGNGTTNLCLNTGSPLLNGLLLSITLATYLRVCCGVLNNLTTVARGQCHSPWSRPPTLGFAVVCVVEVLGIISKGRTPIFC